jgi:hypothetical protein
MFASAQIKKDEVVSVWGGTILLTEKDIAGNRQKIGRIKDMFGQQLVKAFI